MVLFIGSKWFCLQDEVLSVFAIVISPTMDFRNFSGPITMTWTNRGCPFQSICLSWIFCSDFPSLENRIEKVENKHELHSEYHHGNSRNKSVQAGKLIEGRPSLVFHITTGHT